jgi:hypothetical protein
MNVSGENSILADRSNSSVDGRPLEERVIEARINAAEEEVEQMQEKSRQFRVASERLRHELRKLLEESDRLEAEERALQQKVASNKQLIVDLQFEDDLLRLRRNDMECMDTVRNDVPFGYGHALGPALLVNTNLVELFLDLQFLLPLGICDMPAAFVGPILQFVTTSASLRHLYLFEGKMNHLPSREYDPNAERLAGMLVAAMVRNSCIETVSLDLRKPVAALQRIARTGMKLQSLHVKFCDSDDEFIRPGEHFTIASCIASLPMLQHLALMVFENPGLVACILDRLTRMQTSLRHLKLTVSKKMDEFSAALSRFLANSTTLEQFEMMQLYFTVGHMQDLLSGLRHIDTATGVSTVKVTTLSFSQCEFDLDAYDLLATFLQFKTKDANGAMILQSALRNLHFEGWYNRLDWSLSVHLPDSLLMAQTTDCSGGIQMLPTIGSLVQSVSLVGPNGIFLQRLGENSDRVRLETLRLEGISKKFCKRLARYLPRLVSLRTLSVAEVGTGGTPWILHGLKKSGQLHSLESDDDDVFDATQLRLIEVYCQRNRVLVEWLEKVSEQSDKCHNDAHLPMTLQLSSFPTLLEVAKQVPTERATVLLRGLLGLERLETAAICTIQR